MGKVSVRFTYGVVIGLVLLAGGLVCSLEPVFRPPGADKEEGVYRGEPLSYWLDELQARDPAMRQEAVEALRLIGPRDPRVLPALAGMVQDPDPAVRKRAVYALRRMGSKAKPAVPSLVRALEDEDREIRLMAAYALGHMQLKDESVIIALLPMLKDEYPKVRQAMLQFLGDLGPAARVALPAVRQALDDPDADVRGEASEALEKIGGMHEEERRPR
jgi:HEAT repeat protein